VGDTDQEDFINVGIEIRTDATPDAIHESCARSSAASGGAAIRPVPSDRAAWISTSSSSRGWQESSAS